MIADQPSGAVSPDDRCQEEIDIATPVCLRVSNLMHTRQPVTEQFWSI